MNTADSEEQIPAFIMPAHNPMLDVDNVKMRASIAYVLERLESQSESINPSLLVIRECIRELRRYRQ